MKALIWFASIIIVAYILQVTGIADMLALFLIAGVVPGTNYTVAPLTMLIGLSAIIVGFCLIVIVRTASRLTTHTEPLEPQKTETKQQTEPKKETRAKNTKETTKRLTELRTRSYRFIRRSMHRGRKELLYATAELIIFIRRLLPKIKKLYIRYRPVFIQTSKRAFRATSNAAQRTYTNLERAWWWLRTND